MTRIFMLIFDVYFSDLTHLEPRKMCDIEDFGSVSDFLADFLKQDIQD